MKAFKIKYDSSNQFGDEIRTTIYLPNYGAVTRHLSDEHICYSYTDDSNKLEKKLESAKNCKGSLFYSVKVEEIEVEPEDFKNLTKIVEEYSTQNQIVSDANRKLEEKKELANNLYGLLFV